jgi:hypothetical protein
MGKLLMAALAAAAVAAAGAARAQPSPPPPPDPPAQDQGGRIRDGAAAAEAFMGPLDGGWTVMAGGEPLFVLQLSDHDGVLEGAWGDPARPGVSGLVDFAQREAAGVRLRFAGAQVVGLRLGPGGWSGRLVQGARRRRVQLIRRAP